MLPSQGLEYPENKRYRYGLRRKWGVSKTALWILANPSTADSEIDDHTITKVCKFTEGLGLQSLIVMNLYARRATDPNSLHGQKELVGDSDVYIKKAVKEAWICFVGWGGCLANIRHDDVPFSERILDVVSLLSELEPLFCLGPEKGCGPRPWHPGASCVQPNPTPGEQQRIPWRLEC